MSKDKFELEVGERYLATICSYTSTAQHYMEFTVLEICGSMIKIRNAGGDHWKKLSDFERTSDFQYDGYRIIEKLPSPSKQPKEPERIRAYVSTQPSSGQYAGSGKYQRYIHSNIEIPIDKLNAVGAAIEQVLNKEGSLMVYSRDGYTIKSKTEYEKDLEDARRDAFEAGSHIIRKDYYAAWEPKYKTFEDYLNQLNSK